MKLRIFGLMILLVFCFGVVSAYAEDPKNQMYYVLEVGCSPSSAAAYEKAHKAYMLAHQKHNFPIAYTAYSSGDFCYYYTIEINSFSDIDNINKSVQDFNARIGKNNYQKLLNGFAGTYEYLRSFILNYRPDLSYNLENSQLSPEDIKFIRWNMYYVKAGSEQEMENVLKEWIALSNKINLQVPWSMFIGGIGTDTPYFLESLVARSASEHYKQYDGAGNLIGEEGNILWAKQHSFLRKYEEKTGMPRPDLSYTPKTEQGK
jgi:hypothetical protein